MDRAVAVGVTMKMRSINCRVSSGSAFISAAWYWFRLPVRQDLVLENGDVLFRDDDRVTRLAGDQLVGMRVEASGTAELAVDHRVAPRRTGAAHEQLVVFDVNGVMRQDVGQRLAPSEHRGLAFAGLHGLRQQAGPLDVEADGLVAEAFEHPVDARALRPARRRRSVRRALASFDALFVGRQARPTGDAFSRWNARSAAWSSTPLLTLGSCFARRRFLTHGSKPSPKMPPLASFRQWSGLTA